MYCKCRLEESVPQVINGRNAGFSWHIRIKASDSSAQSAALRQEDQRSMSSSKVKIPVRCILELLDLMERKHSYSSLPVLRSYTTNMNKCGVSVPFPIIAIALSPVTHLSVTPRAPRMGTL